MFGLFKIPFLESFDFVETCRSRFRLQLRSLHKEPLVVAICVDMAETGQFKVSNGRVAFQLRVAIVIQ